AVFLFQAEGGIRDRNVTGVQTCALPILIGDLHDHEFGEENQKLAEKISEIEPDLILMDGDMLNSDSESARVPVTLIQKLKDVAPIYYALGNHEEDYIARGNEDLIQELTNAGAVVLDQE